MVESSCAPRRPTKHACLAGRILCLAAVVLATPSAAAASDLFELAASASTIVAARQDLAAESLYLRLRALAYLAQHAGAGAPAALRTALQNDEPLVRFQALRLLQDRFPDSALPEHLAALADGHPWVRLQAAAFVSEHAEATVAAVIDGALADEHDTATKRYLEVALARAKQLSPPAPRQPATAATDAERRVWTTHQNAENTPASPFDAYIRSNISAIREMTAAKAAGKVVYGRTLWGQLPDPVQLLLDAQEFDDLWSKFDGPEEGGNLAVLDGMDFRVRLHPWINWEAGWQAFCRDAGLDPQRVNGERDNLSVPEQRAYGYWQLDRAVAGFNLTYDLIKLKTRYTRPNLQVSTYLPTHAPAHEPLRRLKFDLGMVEQHITTDPLVGYGMCRMYKTLWPDRPVVYKTHALGSLPSTSYWVYFDRSVPDEPIEPATTRPYVHALLAWMSGAHLALTGRWYFLAPGYKKGFQKEYHPPGFDLHIEDFGPDLTVLDQALAFAFEGAVAYTKFVDQKLAHTGVDADPDDLDTVLDEDPLAGQRAAMRVGMRLMQKHVYDCARLFNSLPRLQPQPRTLVVEPGFGVSYRLSDLPYPKIPGKALVNQFDFLTDLNLISACDLTPYKIIVVHRTALLTDETIRRVSQWLQETAGLLIVHRELSADNSNEASTVADHDGLLQADWPWEPDLATVLPEPLPTAGVKIEGMTLTSADGQLAVDAASEMSHFICSTAKAQALLSRDGQAVLACWRDPDHFRGAVLFDGLQYASKPYLDFLRREINALAADGIGQALPAETLVRHLVLDQLEAVASPAGQDAVKTEVPLAGVDLLAGIVDPVAGAAARSALVAREPYCHRYLACTPDIAALGEHEFSAAAVVDGILQLENTGLIQVVSRTPLQIVRADASRLPVQPFSIAWLLDGTGDGVATYEAPREHRRLTFVRSAAAIRISASR